MRTLLLTALLCALTACASGFGASGMSAEQDNAFIASSYQAVDQLLARQSRTVAGPGQKILVSTIVNLNKLNESSAFGRLLAEHAASRLVQVGARVPELKLRGSLFISERQGGELLLSREIQDISNQHNADALLVGTYTEAANQIYVTLKLVRAQDAQIVSAYNYALDKQGQVAGLLR